MLDAFRKEIQLGSHVLWHSGNAYSIGKVVSFIKNDNEALDKVVLEVVKSNVKYQVKKVRLYSSSVVLISVE
jgi:hypothetical protein